MICKCGLPTQLASGLCCYCLDEAWIIAGDGLLKWWEGVPEIRQMETFDDELEHAASELGITLDCHCGKSHRGDCAKDEHDDEDRRAEAYEDDR